MGELSTLFAPQRVAVVGASEETGTVGYAITSNLLAEFEGETVAVNPNQEEVLGLDCHDSLTDLENVDVAIVVVPATVAVDVVRDAARAGIENVVVVTAGFSEAGSDGSAREAELVEIATEHDLNVVGPNSLGVMSTGVGMNATFGPRTATPGTISFMSQSGAFITAVLDWAGDREIGFRDIVSLGNKAVLDESDFVREWGDDPETDVILGYLEDVADGREFIEAAREVTRETPIVTVKSGRTEAGASAAASHTGAIAGSDEAYEAGFKQAGVLRVDTVQELFDFASILDGQPLPDGDGVAIVTNAGGPGVMTTDAVGDAALRLAEFEDETLDRLSEALPSEANIFNPVDVIGDADVERFATAIEIALSDPGVGMAVVLACPTATLSFEALADETVRLQAEYATPVAATLMGGSGTDAAAATLREAGIPTYFDPARAVRSLDALREYAAIRDHDPVEPTTFDVEYDRAREILTSAVERGRTHLGVESMDLLDAYGISTPQGEVVDSPGDAERVAREIGGEVVMKIVSPDISHKSDIGGVEVGVPQEAVRDTYEDIVVRARNYQPDGSIVGVQIQEMVDLDEGTETIIGVSRDPQFGPLVMFGLGGIFVEVMEDTAFRVAPVAGSEARAMLGEIKSAPLLSGARGRTPADRAALVETIQRVSQLVTDFPAITELDINPVVAQPEGATAVDLRLTLDQEKL
ncbi:CoA-binding protein [Halovenus sp. WSH3]|uniref:acetate--CoA ligase (ADP-forming) n=1 Tax=Halovenus carboxidivorans TaxID=2692199 RepID=A0A6B0T5G0_9EURY|nr:acetate--CoA ligase [Halovenus carboxidivorans]MXR50793.1 CoA-binding protein [Halovenus carboxidivorans]